MRSTMFRFGTLSLATVAATAFAAASLAMPASASTDVGVAATPPKKKLLFTNKNYDAEFWLGPCKAIAWHRNIGSVTGPRHWTYMVSNTQLHNSPKDCWAEVKLSMRAMKDSKLHTLRVVKKNGTATVDGTGARCWSQHTIHYKGYSYTISLTRDPGTKC